MSQATFHPETGSVSEGLTRWTVFVGRRFGQGNSKSFALQIASSFPERWTDRAHATDYFIGVDQKVPDWVVGITFLGKVKTEVRPGIKLRFSAWALAHVMPFWASN